jgi:hypothetical protein
LAIAETYRWGHHHIYPPLHTLLLTLLTAPVHLWTLLHTGVDARAFAEAQQAVWPMTIIEIVARLVAVAMAGLTIRNIGRLFGNGLTPALCALLYAPFAYYAKVGNLDVPALFWVSCALVAARACNIHMFSVFAVCAALTKDQAVGLLLLPALWLAWETRARPGTLLRSCSLAALGYGVLSGALVNPHGFAARIAELAGPASQTWANHSTGLSGRVEMIRAIVAELADASSPIVLVLAALGLWFVRTRPLPALAALSFFLTFLLGARRSEARFVMPLGLMLLPYASIPLAMLRKRSNAAANAVTVFALLPAGAAVFAQNATLVGDARYGVETYLAALPARTSIAYLGGPKFAPRLPKGASRPGVEPLETRDGLAGMREVVQSALLPDADVLVLSSELQGEAGKVPHGVSAYMDPSSQAFLRALHKGETSYERVLEAHCTVPWPFRCRPIHGSAGGSLSVYRRRSFTPE